MYGGDAPAPPPDYTEEKRAAREEAEAAYQKRADAYNERVNAFNNNLNQYKTNLNSLSSNIGGLTMNDLWDNPNTAQNENMYDSYMSQVNDYTNQLSGLDTNFTKPQFASTLQTEYGSVGVTVPDLASVNMNLYNQLTGNAGGLSTQLNNLKKQRAAEEQRISDFRGGLMSDLAQYETGLNQLGIADLNQMNQMERDLSALNAKRNSFSSSLMSQLYPNGFDEVGSRYSGLMTGLSDLRDARSAEEKRISDYEAGLLANADQYRNTLSGYTIADEAGMGSLQDLIDQQQRQAGRFSSELGFNFNDELGELSDVELALNQLQRDRTNELNRIDTAQNNYLNTARAIEQAAEGAGIYSQSGLNAISDNLRDLKTNIGDFDSLLNYDFSGATGSITEAEAALAAVNERRQAELDKIFGGIGGATEGLSDIDLYDEAAIRDRLSQLRDVEGQLAPFSGGRVDDIQAGIDTGVESVNARLQELADYRSNLEQQAQSLMETVNNASYYREDDLGDNQSAYDAIQAEAELYNAQQAMDEVDAIMNRLNSERGRLQADAEAVKARNAEALSRMNLGATGLPEFGDLSQVDPYTLQQYLAMLNEEEEEEPTLGQLANAGFSNNLGIIRIGG